MKATLILAGFLLLAGRLTASTTCPVELNGIVCLFGGKSALFVLAREAEAKPTSFMLSEGESQFGIKLLAVDVVGRRVQIEESGIKQFLRICSAPNLPAADNEDAVGGTNYLRSLDKKAVEVFLASTEAQRIKDGNPVWNGAAPGGGQNPGAAANNAGDTTVNAVASSSIAQNHDVTKEYWYQDCLATEQSRIQFADQILAGEVTPYPRTPLTPAGTPNRLVDGRDLIYASHIPGFRMTGYVD